MPRVAQEDLFNYLNECHAYTEAVMNRKGREIAKDLVLVEKGQGFLTDRIQLAPGVEVKPRDRVIAKETLLCNGAGNCERACGGFGRCIESCEKKTLRGKYGHRCSFRLILKMKANDCGFWNVEFEGKHVPAVMEWQPPKKNLLKNDTVRHKCLDAIEHGQASTARQLAMQLPEQERPKKRQLETFLNYRRSKKQKSVKQQCLVEYTDSERESDSDQENLLGDQENFFGLV